MGGGTSSTQKAERRDTRQRSLVNPKLAELSASQLDSDAIVEKLRIYRKNKRDDNDGMERQYFVRFCSETRKT